LFLPFVPGIVVTVGVTLSHSAAAQQFSAIQIGYNTKLAIAVALTYVIGLALMIVTGTCADAAIALLKPHSGAGPWNNPYLRRVAASYLGSTLLPEGTPTSSGDAERTARFMWAVAGKTAQFPDITALRERVEQSEDILKKATDAHGNRGGPVADTLSEVSRSVAEQKEALEKIEKDLGTVTSDVEWLTFYGALKFLDADVQSPFESYQLLTASLQAAAVGSIWLMLQVRELRNSVAICFAIVLLMATIHRQWAFSIVNRHVSDYALVPIAAMIKAVRQRSNPEASPENKQ
jgi:hypothetical protein